MPEEKYMKLNRAIKVRIYPDKDQKILLAKTFGCCRYIWNQMLMDEEQFYDETDEFFIPTPARYKQKAPWLKEVDSLALCNTQRNLEKAFKDFFKNPGHFGHPHVKTKKRSKNSYTTNCQTPKGGNPTVEVIAGCGIKLPKLGVIPAYIHRQPMPGWELKGATVSQSSSGNYYCSLLYENVIQEPEEVLPTQETTIGLDYSSPLFYVDDQGNSPEREQFFRASEKKLARLQRQLSHMQKDSKNYQKQLRKIQVLHEHIANQRKDFIHKESRRIANACDAVCVEDINLAAMSRSLHLGKSTLDNGFGMFRDALKYKLEEQGKHLIVIDKWFPSSKTCHSCGYVKKDLTLKDRIWVCPVCGQVVERDQNAGANIRDEGIRSFYEGRGLPVPIRPVSAAKS